MGLRKCGKSEVGGNWVKYANVEFSIVVAGMAQG